MSAPWRNTDSPLARAWSVAYDRVQAVSGDDEGPATQMNEQRIALLFSGFDIDGNELRLYSRTTARMAALFMDGIGRAIIEKADQDGEGREDYAPRLRAVTIDVMQGIAQTIFLAGATYGRELERTTGVGKPLSPPSEGSTLADPARWIQPGRVPSIAERVELSRDAIQAVLDLECDRLDRTAATLAALGIERAAHLLTAAAAVLRFELEGGGVITEELLPMIRAHHAQIKRVQEAQARNLQAALDMPDEQRERYLADLILLEQRHERERRELDDEKGQHS